MYLYGFASLVWYNRWFSVNGWFWLQLLLGDISWQMAKLSFESFFLYWRANPMSSKRTPVRNLSMPVTKIYPSALKLSLKFERHSSFKCHLWRVRFQESRCFASDKVPDRSLSNLGLPTLYGDLLYSSPSASSSVHFELDRAAILTG